MGACLSSSKTGGVVPSVDTNTKPEKVQKPSLVVSDQAAFPSGDQTLNIPTESTVFTKPTAKAPPKRRKSVSSEPGKQLETITIKVVPKDDATKARLREIISSNPILKELDHTQKSQLVDAMFERKVIAGETIIREGEEGDNFYIVDQGRYVATIQGSPKMVYDNRGCFGELALMYNCARAATITASTLGTLWALDRPTFRSLVVAAAAQRRKRHEQFLKSVTLLQGLGAEQRAAIADCLTAEFYKPGEVLIKQGDPLNEESKFYILEAGRVDCFRNIQGEKKLTKSLNPGDVFGEVALLTDEPRQAGCIAASHVQVLTMCKAAFERLMGPAESLLHMQVEEYQRQNHTTSSYGRPKQQSTSALSSPLTSGGPKPSTAEKLGAASNPQQQLHEEPAAAAEEAGGLEEGSPDIQVQRVNELGVKQPGQEVKTPVKGGKNNNNKPPSVASIKVKGGAEKALLGKSGVKSFKVDSPSWRKD